MIDSGRKPVPISVNVSRIDIYTLNVTRVFQELISRYCLDPRLIEIEITESAYVEEYKVITAVVEELRSAGFTVLMDDFGSGYSSLNMLKDVNVDVLKIDMKFLDMDHESVGKGMGILEAITRMANIVGIRMIAEGLRAKSRWSCFRIWAAPMDRDIISTIPCPLRFLSRSCQMRPTLTSGESRRDRLSESAFRS